MPGVQRIGGAMSIIRVADLEALEVQPEGSPPMLRFRAEWAYLSRAEVEQLRDALTDWLERP
jgi:hypothetical protein